MIFGTFGFLQVTPSTQTHVSNSVSQAVAMGNSNQANLLSSLVQALTSMAAPVPAQPPTPIPAAQVSMWAWFTLLLYLAYVKDNYLVLAMWFLESDWPICY